MRCAGGLPTGRRPPPPLVPQAGSFYDVVGKMMPIVNLTQLNHNIGTDLKQQGTPPPRSRVTLTSRDTARTFSQDNVVARGSTSSEGVFCAPSSSGTESVPLRPPKRPPPLERIESIRTVDTERSPLPGHRVSSRRWSSMTEPGTPSPYVHREVVVIPSVCSHSAAWFVFVLMALAVFLFFMFVPLTRDKFLLEEISEWTTVVPLEGLLSLSTNTTTGRLIVTQISTKDQLEYSLINQKLEFESKQQGGPPRDPSVLAEEVHDGSLLQLVNNGSRVELRNITGKSSIVVESPAGYTILLGSLYKGDPYRLVERDCYDRLLCVHTDCQAIMIRNCDVRSMWRSSDGRCLIILSCRSFVDAPPSYACSLDQFLFPSLQPVAHSQYFPVHANQSIVGFALGSPVDSSRDPPTFTLVKTSGGSDNSLMLSTYLLKYTTE